ncbi:mismatch-specific DNA-glycosylase [Bacillus spongiae]|uniref:Mismatch-specific DNA-glycosylase n=1 Tax=Bacillus spongiae TaxID=2683610 RepID=A0ABU8HIT8_9BACI
MNEVVDHLQPNLKIVFIGYNPSVRSSEQGHHYAHPSNRFWKILHAASLTPRVFHHSEDQNLLSLGYGFTNIVSRPTKAAADITSIEYDEGRVLLQQKLGIYLPKVAFYVGKGVYQQLTKRKKIYWGKQEESVVGGVIDFVAPSSSGLVRMNIDEMSAIYQQLNRYI